MLVSLAALPHGALLLDYREHFSSLGLVFPDVDVKNGVDDVAAQSVVEVEKFCALLQQACSRIAAASPELLVLVTPHGLQTADEVILYANRAAKGSAEWQGAWAEHRIECVLDTDATASLAAALKAVDVPCSSLVAFAEGEPIPLRWGEAVPLCLLAKAFQPPAVFPRCVIVSLPSRRHAFDAPYEAMLDRLAQGLDVFAREEKRRVSVVMSADLAHTHACPATHPGAPFAPLPAAAEAFDAALEAAVRALASIDGMAGTAGAAGALRELQTAITLFRTEHVLSCGLSGLVVLVRLAMRATHVQPVIELLGRIHPTYYGMLVAVLD